MSDPELVQKINDDITSVDWSQTSAAERNRFAQAMSTFELSKTAQSTSKVVSSARLNSLILTMLVTVVLMLVEVDSGIILGVCLSMQALFLGLSQLVEYGANVLCQRAETSLVEITTRLKERHPTKEGTDAEDIFIL
jgi:hypothetical protein